MMNDCSNSKKTAGRAFSPTGGRPPLEVDFVALSSAVKEALEGNGETITSVAQRFGVSRGYIPCEGIPGITVFSAKENDDECSTKRFREEQKEWRAKW